MEARLNSINDIINLIDKFNINDLNIINEICTNCLGIGFMPIQVAGDIPPKEYYIQRLQIYEKRLNEGLELPSWLNSSVPFQITDFYNPSTFDPSCILPFKEKK